MQTLVGFRSRKAAQVAAFFVRLEGGRIDKLKLSKIMYLTERESMAARGRPIFYDEFYSLKDGPICSNALDGINQRSKNEGWGLYLRKESNRDITLAHTLSDDDLDELSRSDIDVLNSVWEKFGWMKTTIIRRWTHENCAEYTEVEAGKRLPISYGDVYAALGFDAPEQMAEQVVEYRSIEAALDK